MRKISTILMAISVCLLMALLSGCAKQEMQQAGFLEDYSTLQPDPIGFADKSFKKENVVWGAYDKVMIDQIMFFLKDDAQYKGIDADDFNQLAQYWNDSMVKSLSKSYKIATEPGPNTLRLRLAITNLVPNKPAMGTITTVVPVGLAASELKKIATGTHIGMGSAGFEAEIRDAQSGDLLASAVNWDTGKKYKIAKSLTEWGQVEAIFDEWTDNIRKRLDKFSGR